MTFKFSDVYINDTYTVVGPYEKKGPLGKKFDKTYDDLYMEEKTWEQAEIKLLEESVISLLSKIKLSNSNIDIHISGDLLNQLTATNFASSKIKIPLIGVFSACATSCEGLIIGASLLEGGLIKNCICSTSSHNTAAEKQFRYPSEYGAPKAKTSTFTSTGGASAFLSTNKKGIKIEAGTIGTVQDLGIDDPFNMGAVMAPAAAVTIYKHLTDMDRTVDDYDLILTGDLGEYGSKILREYMKEEYKINLHNHKDCGTMLFNLEEQPVDAGASGAACAPLVAYTEIFEKIKNGKYKRVLLVATGALLSQTTPLQKLTIPSIAHAVSLEAIK